MTKVDLVTGFLGAGKTIFLKKYLGFLRRSGEETFLIENEFGCISIDTVLLKNAADAMGDLTGECMCCSGYDDFRMLLMKAAENNYSRILVEPSGIYDVDQFFRIMNEPEVRKCCEIGSVITIVAPNQNRDFSDESEYLMMGQIAAAGTVVLSRTQDCADRNHEDVVCDLNRLLDRYGADRILQEKDICFKDWKDLNDEDFEKVAASGYHQVMHKREQLIHDELYITEILSLNGIQMEQLRAAVRELFIKKEYGDVLRIKGYVRDISGKWYEVNCTPDIDSFCPADVNRGVLVIIGQYLNREAIRRRMESISQTRK